ncbi:HipA N-terminal domain-containing protein (plasmid) [Cupriavidus pinatubonensis]|uniref:HipA N-terminal domain-containing protein n=1 Tax=Cupriavidus pinatubonensis TaxID=248026 RepID=UPI001C734B2C|nr:HipA N-terminal domain-containing protein [Cupriavidus pinatubonensis]QYY33564.1 HipA N-terminal domain-containing protein [Cupriavidus pinatubonensis]
MNDHLFVWFYPPPGHDPLLCGRLDLIGGRQCLFSYAPEYLNRSNAIALCPDLPLLERQYVASAGVEMHPIFEDAGPDRWGRRVMDLAVNPRRRAAIDYLALAGVDRIGALGFSGSGESSPVRGAPPVHRGA